MTGAAYQHLATKADLAELKAELKSDIGDLKADIIKWTVGMMIASVTAASSIALLVQRLME